jgi:hypothetical protein
VGKAEKLVNTSLDESRLLLEEMDVMLSRVRVLMQSRPKAKLVKTLAMTPSSRGYSPLLLRYAKSNIVRTLYAGVADT